MKRRIRSVKQEKRVASELRGNTVIASGSLWGSKGDVRSEDFLVECKTTEKSFYSLTLSTWLKIRTEAIKDGLRLPAMCIDLENGGSRFAVLEKGVLSVEDAETFDVVVTSKKSFRIKTDTAPMFISFTSRSTESVDLAIVPWHMFLEYVGGEVY